MGAFTGGGNIETQTKVKLARELTNNLNSLRAIVLNALNDCAGQTINYEVL